MAGKDRGAYFLPEVDDEVLVAFEHGQVDHPFVIGSLWNGKDDPPESNVTVKITTGRSSRAAVMWFASMTKPAVKPSKSSTRPGNNKIIIDSAKNTITIEAQSDITIKSATGKLTMQANGIEMKSQMGVSVEAAQNMDLKANAIVTVKGAMIRLN